MSFSESIFTPKTTIDFTPHTTPGLTLTPKRRISNDSCPYCLELLSNLIENEQVVEMACSHSMHLNCLLLLINQIDNLNNDDFDCPRCNMKTSPMIDLSTLKQNNFDFEPLIDHNELIFDNESELNMLPITPIDQIGTSFWESNNIETPIFKNHPSNANNEINLSKVSFIPKQSFIDRESRDNNIQCLLNLSTINFDSVNKNDELRNDIMKSSVINSLISKFLLNYKLELDVNDLNRCILFDFFDSIEISYSKSLKFGGLVCLFETSILIIDHENKLFLNQFLDSNDIFISSVFSSSNSIIINLNSMKIPEIKLTSNNNILLFKWLNLLKSFNSQDQFDLYDTITLTQLSVNAWNLIDKPLPNDIEVIKKLNKNNMDLPNEFIQKQLIKPVPVPLKLILIIPLYNNIEQNHVTNSEYSIIIKSIIRSVLETSLNSNDQLGLIFVNRPKNVNSIGSYYGCTSTSWDGWETILESIDQDIISNELDDNQWVDGLKLLKLLGNLHLNDSKFINQVLFLTNQLIDANQMIRTKNNTNPFQNNNRFQREIALVSIIDFIRNLCSEFDIQFNTILIIDDEFKFELIDIYYHIHSFSDNTFNSSYINKLIIDYYDLQSCIIEIIDSFHQIIIKNLKIKVVEEPGFKIISNEVSDNTEITFKNLKPGFDKSFLITLEIDEHLKRAENGNKEYSLLTGSISIDNKVNTFCEPKMKVQSRKEFENDKLINLLPVLNQPMIKITSSPTRSIRKAIDSNSKFVKKEIEQLVKDTIFNLVIKNTKTVDSTVKANIQSGLRKLLNTIWEIANEDNDANIQWVEELVDELNYLIEGYNLRNITLTNIKCLLFYLNFI